MERIPFGIIPAMTEGGMGTYDNALRGAFPITWFKREGDTVLKGEAIASLETDKVVLEIVASCSGRIVSVFSGKEWSADGKEVETQVGTVISPPFGEIEESPKETEKRNKMFLGHVQAGIDAVDGFTHDGLVAPQTEVCGASQEKQTRLTPLARKIAEAKGVDVSQIKEGTGAGGRVCAKDVENAKSQTPPSSPRAAPAARAYAEAHEIDLTDVKGTGPDGLILLSDVEKALWEKHREHLEPVAEMTEKLRVETQVAESKPYFPKMGKMMRKYHDATSAEPSRETPAQEELGEPLRDIMEDMNNLHGELWAKEHADETVAHDAPTTSKIRKTIARLLTRSCKEILHAGDTITADVTVLLEFIWRYNETAAPFSGIKLRLDHLIAWYAQEILLKDEFCILNGYWNAEKEEAVCLPKVNIGIAVDTERGLVVPVVHDAGRLSFSEFVVAASSAIERARRGALGLHEIRDLTFTVNNTGVLGGENPSPIIPYTIAADGTERPTAMILALARLRKERRRSFLPVVFRFDHRLCDGREALAFARELRERIESKKSPEEFTAELSASGKEKE